ncbi:MAG TPA: PAS domain S-box protein, partial [Flavobacteriales bacterium]|nr:PAS domain S-box protein [Flavobacteriales bacterium]
IFDYVRPERIDWMKQVYASVLSGESKKTEVEFINNGNLISYCNKYKPYYLDNGEIGGVVVLSIEQTEQKIAENKLRESEARFRSLIENSSEMIVLADEQGRFVYLSPSFERITGFAVEASLGHYATEYLQPDFIEKSANLFQELIDNPGKTYFCTSQIKCKDGSLVWLEGTVTNLLHDPNVKAVVSNYRDSTSRKLAESKILESERRFRAIVEQYPMPVITYQPSGLFISANAAWEEMWEDKIENVKGYNILEDKQMIDSGLFPFIKSAFSGEVVTTPVFDYDPKLIGKNGRKRWIQMIIYPLKDEKNNITEVILITQDYTAIHEAEIKLSQSEAKFKSLIQNSQDGIGRLTNDGTLLEMSPSGRKILGYDIHEFVGKIRPDLIHENDIGYLKEAFEDVVKNPGNTRSVEYRYLHPDGQIHWIETNFRNQLDDPAVAAIVNNFRDITDRKHKEEQILRLNKKLKTAQEIALLGYWEINLQDGENYLSDEIYRICRIEDSSIDFPMEDFMKLVHPKDLKRFIENHENLVQTGEAFETEYRMLFPDRKQKIVLSKGNLVYDQEGKPLIIEGTLQDITALKKVEKELMKLNNQLKLRAKQLADSNAELEQFAYIASHDLQEPLRMVTSFMSQLEKKYSEKLDDKAQQYIHFAMDGAVRMRTIILDLLEFSRIGKSDFDFEEVDMNALVLEAIKQNKKLVEEKSAHITHDKLPSVWIQRTPLLQVFQNLLGNSLKYMESGKKPQIHIGVEELSTKWIFSITDNGIGINEQFFDKIFILFQRLHNRDEYSGTGIGLAICKKIVEKYGGEIWVESTEGNGATFYFSLLKGIKNSK